MTPDARRIALEALFNVYVCVLESFDESKVKRADDGKFGSGGGAASAEDAEKADREETSRMEAEVQDKNAWQEKHYGDWTTEVRKADMTASKDAGSYAGNMFAAVNSLLRNPDKPGPYAGAVAARAAQVTKSLERMFEGVPGTPEALTLYRGVYGPFAETVRNLQPGDEIHDAGFGSASMSELVAKKGFRDKETAGVLIQIHAPAGTKAVPMYRWADKQEAEMLLPKGTTYKVKGIEGGVLHVEIS